MAASWRIDESAFRGVIFKMTGDRALGIRGRFFGLLFGSENRPNRPLILSKYNVKKSSI